MTMKARITTILALLIIAVTSSWAQDYVTVTPTGNANEWTFEIPDADVEIEVEYYTDEELYEEGVELTKTADGEWTLAAMPAKFTVFVYGNVEFSLISNIEIVK